MKTKVLVLGAVITAFAFTSFAAEPLLSPRAKDNQIKIVKSSVETPTVTVAYVDSSAALLSPRYDDGRFTYLRFPGNREVPAVFHVLGDGSETLVNARMEDDLLVVDRVSRKLMLRAGQAVVGLWNEAFDLDGRPPGDGTTVPGVQRVLKADAGGNNALPGARKGTTP